MSTMKEIFEKALKLRKIIETKYKDIDVADLVDWLEDRPHLLDATFRLELNATEVDIKTFEILTKSMAIILRDSSNPMFTPTRFVTSSEHLTRYMTEQMEYAVNEMSSRISLREKAEVFERNIAALKEAMKERNSALVTGACHDLFLDDNYNLNMQTVKDACKFGIYVSPAKVDDLGWPDLSEGVVITNADELDVEWTYSLV